MKKQTNDDFRGAGRVAFLARKDRIQKMVDEGYPLSVIHEKYKDDLKISYGQFTRYINKYIRSAPRGNEEKPKEQTARTSESEHQAKNDAIHEEPTEEVIFDEKQAEEGDFF